MSPVTSAEGQFNPFPGLRPFRSDEHHLFFGREDQAAELLSLLRTSRFLAVVGTSGSGKSSLVRAGLIPELHGGTMARAGSTWEVLLLRPGGRPLENLARALAALDLYDADDPGTLPRLRATLSRSRFGLVEAVKQSDVTEPDTNLLVVVDQFEELFRFRQQSTDSEEVATAFVNLLLTSSAQEERQIYVTLTMRSDYLGDCSEIPGLAEAVNRGEYLIPRLMRDQKRDAIEKPIGVGGARIAPLLVQRLLNDIGDDPDQLPVLQHALMRMWDVWSTAGDSDRPIDFCDLEATGGLAHALSRHADEIYDALPGDADRAACERIFRTLTEKGADNRGIRRPTRLERLEAIAASDRATVTRVLEAFRRPGVTFIMPGIDRELTDRTVIDLSHESLMRGWQRLRAWVEDEAQSARIFHRLADTASLWRDGKAGLFRDPDLQIALSWREDERPNDAWAAQHGGRLDAAMAFLEKSREEATAEEEAREAARERELEQAKRIAAAERQQAAEQRQSARRLRWLAGGLGVVALVAAAAFLFALAARQEAEENEKLAMDRAAETERQVRATEEARKNLRDQLYISDMNRVGQAFAEGNIREMNRLLDAHRPQPGERDLRGFEWYYWWGASRRDVRTLFTPGAEASLGMAVSPVGTWVAVPAFPGTVKLFDAHRMRSAGFLYNGQERGYETPVSFSPDGSTLAVARRRDSIRLFDATDNWTRLRDLQVTGSSESPQGPRLVFSPSGDTLAAAKPDGDQITLWATETWTPTAFTLEELSLGSNLAFSSDGKLLTFASSSDSLVILWDVASSGIRKKLRGHEAGVLSVAWSPDGRLFASGSSDATVRLWSRDLERVATLRTDGTATDLAFSPDSRYLAAAIKEFNGARVWSTDSNDVVCTIKGHELAVRGLAFAGSSTTLWTASVDGYVKVWDIHRAEPAETLASGTHAPVLGLAALPGHRAVLAHSAGGRIERGDLDGQAAPAPWDENERYSVAALSDDGRFALAATSDGLLRVWDGPGGTLRTEQHIEPELLEDVSQGSISRDGRIVTLLLDKGRSSEIVVCDLERGVERRIQGIDQPSGAASSPGGRYLAVRRIYTFDLWDLSGDEPRKNASVWRPVPLSAAFSADESKLAIGCHNNNIYVYDVETGAPIGTLEGHAGQVHSLAFSPDGRMLVSGSVDRTVRLWALESGKLLSTLSGHQGMVDWVTFAPDSESILSGSSEDGSIKVWHRATQLEADADVSGLVGPALEQHLIENWSKTEELLDKAIAIAPNNSQLLLWRANLRAHEREEILEALPDYRAAAESAPDDETLIRRVADLIDLRPLVASSGRNKITWRFTTDAPLDDEAWKTLDFDDTGWRVGEGPFLSTRTGWSGGQIWLRSEFELEDAVDAPLAFLASIDDFAQFYLNGVPAGQGWWRDGYDYNIHEHRRLSCREAARRALRAGRNILAVRCRDYSNYGRIDVGLYTQSRTSELLEFLSGLLASRPESPVALELRSRASADLGDWNQAFADQKSLRDVEEGAAWDPSRVCQLVPPASSWRYMDEGRDLGMSWREPDHDDRTWKEGEAPLGYGGPVATAIGFGADGQNKHPTTYFRRTFDVEQPEELVGLRVYLRRDDGAAVYLNGVEVVRDNLPAGASYGDFSTGTVNDPEELRYGMFPVAPDVLRAGTNVIAVEVHQVNATSSDVSFDLVLEGLLGKAR